MDLWTVIARIADIVGIVVGIISLVISLSTLSVTRGIRKTMLAEVESSDYLKAIDEQISDLTACRKLLIEGSALSNTFFTKLVADLDDIRISYETILPPNVPKTIRALIKHIEDNLSEASQPYVKRHITKCISKLGYIIAELKKEKNML